MTKVVEKTRSFEIDKSQVPTTFGELQKLAGTANDATIADKEEAAFIDFTRKVIQPLIGSSNSIRLIAAWLPVADLSLAITDKGNEVSQDRLSAQILKVYGIDIQQTPDLPFGNLLEQVTLLITKR